MTSWKRDTAICFSIVVLMYAFVGVVFGLLFGSILGNMESLTIRATLFMALVGLMAVGICYFLSSRPKRLDHEYMEITESDWPSLIHRVRDMCAKAGLPPIKVYITADRFPNAYAWGNKPEVAGIAITRGAFELLNEDEICAVLGHELSHIAHRDTVVKSVASYCLKALTVSIMMMGALSLAILGGAGAGSRGSGNGLGILILLIIGLVLLIFAGILAVTIPGASFITKYAVSRNREYLADAGSVELCGDARSMISALEKLERGCIEGDAKIGAAEAMIWTVNPNARKHRGIMDRIASTHPTNENRIKRLEKLESKMAKEIPSDDAEFLRIDSLVKDSIRPLVSSMVSEGLTYDPSSRKFSLGSKRDEEYEAGVMGIIEAVYGIFTGSEDEDGLRGYIQYRRDNGTSGIDPSSFGPNDAEQAFSLFLAEAAAQSMFDILVQDGVIQGTCQRPLVELSGRADDGSWCIDF